MRTNSVRIPIIEKTRRPIPARSPITFPFSVHVFPIPDTPSHISNIADRHLAISVKIGTLFAPFDVGFYLKPLLWIIFRYFFDRNLKLTTTMYCEKCDWIVVISPLCLEDHKRSSNSNAAAKNKDLHQHQRQEWIKL